MLSRIARPQVLSLAEASFSFKSGNFKNGRNWRQQSRFNSSSKGTSSGSSVWKYGVGVGLVGAVGFATFATLASADEKKVDYAKVRKDIEAVIAKDENRGPTLVRLAWHAAGTYSKAENNGGSDGGTIRHQPEAGYGANAGLQHARQWLESVKQANPGISYADLYTLAGVVAIETMNGPKIPWRSGRVDAPDGKSCTPDGRLPGADKGSQTATRQHIRDIFYRMGFNDQEIVALLGAHSLGRCHTDRSGYDGPWTKAPTVFSNEYFRELLENNWQLRKWKGPQQYADKAGELMMLPADLALVWDPEFKKWVEIYAKDEDRFFKDFSAAFSKLLELGVKGLEKKKGWWPF